MELVIDGHPTFEVEGTVTVELPTYMSVLPEAELASVRGSLDRDKRIVAAGLHPQSSDLVFVTGAGEIYEIQMGQFSLPPVKESRPTAKGCQLVISFVDPVSIDDIQVDSSWALRVGTLLINLGKLADKRGARVSYLDGEDDAGTAPKDDP